MCQHSLKLAEERYEYEGARLLRCIKTLGQIDLDSPAAFDLCLSAQERAVAHSVLLPLNDNRVVIAASIGAKVDVKDWGDNNWSTLLERLGLAFPNAGLVMLGAVVERERSEVLLRHWSGAGLNLCGQLTVRESAAVLEQATLFIGHDSGPMHLAAAVDTPCVAIFSSRNLPGEWFPYGVRHRVLYHSIECQGCGLDMCQTHAKACILSITVNEVLAAVADVLTSTHAKVRMTDCEPLMAVKGSS
jgi:ADP-heptose:LPS heptosyltransferase